MSPRELAAEFEAARLRREDEFNRDVRQAWLGVAIYGSAMSTGKMPAIEQFLVGEAHGSGRDDMVAKLHALAEMTGFPLKVVPKETVKDTNG